MLFDRMPSRSFLYLLYNDDWKTRVLFGTKGAFYEHKQIQKCEMKKNGTRIKFGWDGVLASECHFRTAPTSAWPSRATRSLYGRAFLECSASLSDAWERIEVDRAMPAYSGDISTNRPADGKNEARVNFRAGKIHFTGRGQRPHKQPNYNVRRSGRSRKTHLFVMHCLPRRRDRSFICARLPSFAYAVLFWQTRLHIYKHSDNSRTLKIQSLRLRSSFTLYYIFPSFINELINPQKGKLISAALAGPNEGSIG